MTFAWPTALLALAVLPVLLAGYVLLQRRRRAYALRFTNLALLRQVAGSDPGVRRHIPAALFFLGLTALLVSLARPSLVLAVPQDQSSVMLVIDVSGSMEASDLKPTRLGAATQAAKQLISDLPPGAQVGVVSFSQTASVVAPLSADPNVAGRALDRLTANGGTAIGDGLEAALGQLSQRPRDGQGNQAPAVVVLLSDGENNAGQSPTAAAAQAELGGVRVYTVGVGERGTAAYVDGHVPVGLDETALRAIASTTGGSYFYAADASQLAQVYSDLGAQISWVQQQTEVTALASGLGALCFLASGIFGLRWFSRLP
jgi:Ca-activated chloride channel family protein